MLFELCLSLLFIVTIFCVIGCRISTTFTYFAKLFLIYSNTVFCFLSCWVFGLFHSKWTTFKYTAKFAQPLLNLLDITVDIELPQNFDKGRSYIIVANHQHFLDVCTVSLVCLFDYTTIQRMTIRRLTKWRPDFDILMIQRLFFFEKKAKNFFLPLTGFT